MHISFSDLIFWQVGGSTAKIGDPSGKNSDREALSKQHVDENILGIKTNIATIFANHEKLFWNDTDAPKPIR